MILVKNLKTLQNLFLFQKNLGLIFDNVLVKKGSFSRLQKCYYKKVEILAFSWRLTVTISQSKYLHFFKGQPMILIKNLKIILNLFLFQKGLAMKFDGVLDKKEVFLDYKNVTLRQLKNLHFPMGKDSQEFGQRVRLQKCLKCLKCKIRQKFAFFQGVMILVENLKILRNLFLFQKGLGLIFDDVLVKKRSLSRLQKCYYKIVEILALRG